MGDRDRFVIFARFIKETFPGAQAVADVGGGQGELALELTLLGYDAIVIDPREASILPKKVRKMLRKKALRTGTLPRFGREKVNIESADLACFDLLVGMHPDEATEPIVRNAVEEGKSFAVVPCCVMPIDGISRPFESWLDYLSELAPGSKTAQLPMSGRNSVIFRESDSAPQSGKDYIMVLDEQEPGDCLEWH